MAGTTLQNLGLVYDWTLGTFWKTDNDANLVKLDTVVNAGVIDRDLTAPPGGESEGDLYIPASVATGAWATHENELAVYVNSAYTFYAPKEGWTVWIKDEDVYVAWDGAAWVVIGGGGVGDVTGPGSSTDDGVARFSGTGGKTIQNSGVIIDDNNNTHGHGTTLNAQTGTTYTLTGNDRGKTVTLNNASPITLTIPETSTESITAGFQCTIIQRGAGQVTVATEGTDVLESKSSATKLSAQHAGATIIKHVAGSPNTWGMYGDVTT